jgi:hypothetical protein
MVVHEPREVHTPAEQKVKIAVSVDNFSDTCERHAVGTLGCWLYVVCLKSSVNGTRKRTK